MSNKITIGVDEVGRGCVYGPLVIAAAATIPGRPRVAGVRDSKVMTENARLVAFGPLQQNMYFSLAHVHAVLIDTFGIGNAVHTATKVAFEDLISRILRVHPDTEISVVLDGTEWTADIADYKKSMPHIHIECMAKADAKVYECSAASVIAKVTRDNWIKEICRTNPTLNTQFDLLSNKGYGAPKHKAGLQKYGLTEHHRSGFCKTLLEGKGKRHGKISPPEQLALFP